MLVDPLLRGHHVDELAQLAAQVALPADVDVPVEAHRLVLREDQVLANAAVEAVREREVDDAIDAAERHRRLGAVAGQRLQPRTLAAGQDHRQDFLHVDSIGHGVLCPPFRHYVLLGERIKRAERESKSKIAKQGMKRKQEAEK